MIGTCDLILGGCAPGEVANLLIGIGTIFGVTFGVYLVARWYARRSRNPGVVPTPPKVRAGPTPPLGPLGFQLPPTPDLPPAVVRQPADVSPSQKRLRTAPAVWIGTAGPPGSPVLEIGARALRRALLTRHQTRAKRVHSLERRLDRAYETVDILERSGVATAESVTDLISAWQAWDDEESARTREDLLDDVSLVHPDASDARLTEIAESFLRSRRKKG